MTYKDRYELGKQKLLCDQSICPANREVFREFFEFEEYKLKRTNQLRALDEPSYNTLCGYLGRLRRVNTWFKNKPWKDLTEQDIKQVYDDLEDGKTVTRKGTPVEDRRSYYNRIFKSKPFRIVHKSELAKNVIEFSTNERKEVSYVTEDTFRSMVSVVSKPVHLLLLHLAWDIGENIDALLKLTKRDFTRQQNPHTKEAEYLVNLPRRKIKRSRLERTEPTLYAQTVRYADMVLQSLSDDELIFKFGHRQALKLMHSIAARSGAKCVPDGQPVRWKHLRAGMACHLLRSGWSREEVDARLGHTPNSRALDRYITYMAIDRQKPKKRLFDSSLETIQNELEEARRREKLAAERIKRQGEENTELGHRVAAQQVELNLLRREFRAISRLVTDRVDRRKLRVEKGLDVPGDLIDKTPS